MKKLLLCALVITIVVSLTIVGGAITLFISNKDERVPEEPTSETAPYYPDKTFSKVEGTIDTGLVIADKDGNQYVWVVVPKSLYDDANYNLNGSRKPKSSKDYDNIEYCLQQYSMIYRDVKESKEAKFTDTWVSDPSNKGGLSFGEYTDAKQKMLKSVYENGGFYVGRYEAGIEEKRIEQTDENASEKFGIPKTKPVSKANVYPYTFVTRTQAQKLAESVNHGRYSSSLMFGIQWNLVLAFMSKDSKITSTDELTKDSTAIGNYSNSQFKLEQNGKYAVENDYTLLYLQWKSTTTPTEEYVDEDMNKLPQSKRGNSILITAGTSEQNKFMNIYDIAGNVAEWTLERNSDTYSSCVNRGGAYWNTGSSSMAAQHQGASIRTDSESIGFRVSIY